MNTIKTNSLEIFKTNIYNPYPIGMVSNNAYLSVVVTNNCQCRCSYCINSETDRTLELPINKAIENIKKLEQTYHIKEVILLGGEPTLHSDIFTLIKRLRAETKMIVRLTTNGIKLKDNIFLAKLIDKDSGVQGLNISYHGDDSPIQYFSELEDIYNNIKKINSDIKVRINTNIWRSNLEFLDDLIYYLSFIAPLIGDEIRISNLIPKDSFSVNSINNNSYMGLTIEEYNKLFTDLCEYFSNKYTLIENDKTLGFVKYILIPAPTPIILNWNTNSSVSEQICENNIKTREINSFKCLVNGEISLSWNINNIIKL